jgi:hypothetical protein
MSTSSRDNIERALAKIADPNGEEIGRAHV